MTFMFIIIAALSIYYMNKLMDEFCNQREISGKQERTIFRVANGTTVIWLFTTYIEVMFF
ncbi:hypothetical protein [Fervidibacillus halotolerans]|uniref:Uncharacterized protein n=1 Tax=Fervidibacillus halotolerans TaxID=2980027 RepID=A0A9E8M182_9BACI|nr:hypothetical protein [Fervidibacillus halotolerans]WAA13010.1 hypothetical protein OE105_02470 [Fervidibacillus halotolerans]